MKIILKEYLASLKERGELDKSVLPNLLAEIGLRVLNTPMIGTRQNGVDIAAVGKVKGEDTEKHLYLFCIKAGNINRNDWDGGPQSVHAELNEIREVYLRANVASEHADLPVKICLCCGGEIEETVLMNWAGYTQSQQTDTIRYEEWNGDRLADLMMRCLLARELLEEEHRRNFQKAVAMVNEPSACYEYSSLFLLGLLSETGLTPKAQLLRLRQSYICLNAVTAWAIEADNLESIYRISELGVLVCWHVVNSQPGRTKPTKHDQALNVLLDQYVKLYLSCSERYLSKTAHKHCGRLHALSAAVQSREAVDVNLALFELLGRLATNGLWTAFLSQNLSGNSDELSRAFAENTNRTLDTLVELINSNPTLNSPFKDDHMIEICLVMYLAQLTGSTSRFAPWIMTIANRTTLALVINSHYPICQRDYRDLLNHPGKADAAYRKEVCSGSVLYPYLFVWLHQLGDDADKEEFVDRLDEFLPDCTHQAWLPDEDTDTGIWLGDTDSGVCVTDLSASKGFTHVAEVLNLAIEQCTDINEIGAVRSGLSVLFLTACRHHRLPIPPHFWILNN
ncbi:MAG: hypothetical protein JJ908_14105 [Rhizobiales bacterium]|nr:hypothetical protein [Hyphomicrobiales bacterium]MBO6700336.1 hypothetical protein [Hyphomicrobiales bacterium]MBO6737499.1 hypothetical protein [Hyphomicrobiales bacterium]MBO6913444.1 hypothetical protein [Hyphomicrobiales bacterium]MBO6955375.1 hypothetical protein [Hyphomicrobiales bacterium]